MVRDANGSDRVRVVASPVPYPLDEYSPRIHIHAGIRYAGTCIFFLIYTDIHGYLQVFTKENFNIQQHILTMN